VAEDGREEEKKRTGEEEKKRNREEEMKRCERSGGVLAMRWSRSGTSGAAFQAALPMHTAWLPATFPPALWARQHPMNNPSPLLLLACSEEPVGRPFRLPFPCTQPGCPATFPPALWARQHPMNNPSLLLVSSSPALKNQWGGLSGCPSHAHTLAAPPRFLLLSGRGNTP
jgi:hypothetical protein